jgi:hypothetical protein
VCSDGTPPAGAFACRGDRGIISTRSSSVTLRIVSRGARDHNVRTTAQIDGCFWDNPLLIGTAGKRAQSGHPSLGSETALPAIVAIIFSEGPTRAIHVRLPKLVEWKRPDHDSDRVKIAASL